MTDLTGETQGSVPCTFGYDYNRTLVHSSIITEWDLVCDRARFVDLAQITLMLGILIGDHRFKLNFPFQSFHFRKHLFRRSS